MFNYLQIIRIAYKALRKNKMRTALTMLGIIIGVGAVIAMVSIGQGAKSMVKQQIASLGDNLIIVFPGSASQGGVHFGAGSRPTLTEEDATAIKNQCPAVSRVTPVARSGAQVIAGNQNWATAVEGYNTEFLQIRSWPLSSGTFFTETDVRGATKVCVIGKTIAENLFPDQDPVGQIIRVKRLPFKVLGVLFPKGENPYGRDQDDIIIAPYTTVMKKLQGEVHINQILGSAVDRTQIDVAIDQITQLLRQRHKITANQDDDFTVRSQTEIATAAESTSKIMTILLAAIASVSLLVGGIGIMNIMLVSVTERTREIGIRMAVGAKAKHILIQFLIEALTLSTLGGIIGISLGFLSSILISKFLHWPTSISPQAVFLAFFFSLAVGVFFGFYPARKASQLDPIESLRWE